MSTNATNEFNPEKLKAFSQETPFFVFSKKTLLNNLSKYKDNLPPETEIAYAMKANSEKEVLETLYESGTNFEVASSYELDFLKDLKVPSERIIYGTSVKPPSHIDDFVKYGVDRFAFDSEQELLKIAKHAPKSRVYVRVLIEFKTDSVFNMAKKFGTSLKNTVYLLTKAKALGLVPYGISFNVGSQARNKEAWARGILEVAEAMTLLLEKGIKVEVLNIGGGFPHSYQDNDNIPGINEISSHIKEALKKVPYGVNYIAEPGRGLVANTYVLVTSVIGKNRRSNGHWLYTDAGVYNALMESLDCQGSTKYRVVPLKKYNSKQKEHFILTGPTGDNIDIVNDDLILPTDINIGDKLAIYDTGAYTFTLMTPFNGFPKPKVIKK